MGKQGNKTLTISSKPWQHATPNLYKSRARVHGTSYFQDISFSENLWFSLFYLFYFPVAKEKNHNLFIKYYTVKISWSLSWSREAKWRNILAKESQWLLSENASQGLQKVRESQNKGWAMRSTEGSPGMWWGRREFVHSVKWQETAKL